MNAIAKIEPKSPVEAYVDQVLPADRLQDLARSLPAHIRPELFQRNLLNVVMINYDLMKCEAGLMFREVSKAAGLGLYLDPALGEAYIVMAYNYKTKQLEPQLRIGYRGLTKLARQSGTVSLVYAHEARANDFLECDLGSEKRLVHKPKLFTDRGDIVGYYAVITYNDSAFDFEPMSVADIRSIRDRSDAWKAFTEKKIKSTPWLTDESEMAKKTVIRRLMKRAPQSPELVEALRIEDSAEGYISDRAPAPKRIAPAPPPRLVSPPQETPADEKEPVTSLAKEKSEEAKSRKAPSPPSSRPAVKGSLADRFAEAARGAKSHEELGAVWNEIVEPEYDRMLPDEQDNFCRINRLRAAELPSDDEGEAGEP